MVIPFPHKLAHSRAYVKAVEGSHSLPTKKAINSSQTTHSSITVVLTGHDFFFFFNMHQTILFSFAKFKDS